MSDIETRLLRYFVAVAEELHFGRASLRLDISPPTLTHQIKKLEGQLHIRLLIRDGNTKVLVTDAGQRFLADAREVLRHVEQAAARARQAERGELGRLEVAVLSLLCTAGLLENWIGAFRQAHPAIDVTLHKLVPMAQISGLLRNELDAGFTRTPQEYPRGLRGFEIYRQRLVLALRRKHPLAEQEDISPELLADEPFVSFPPELDVGFVGHTEAVARIGKFAPRVVKREGDFTTVMGYVTAGYGIAVVPELMKTINVPNVVFRGIAVDPALQTSTAFVYGRAPSPSTKLLIQHMQHHALRNGGKRAAPPDNQDRIVTPKAPNVDRHPEVAAERPSKGDGYESVINMNLLRRNVLSLAIGAAAWRLAPRPAAADSLAPRLIHIVVGFPAGGVGDIASRLIGQSLQQRLGQSVVIDNRPGAGANLAIEAVVKARPDGGTLLLTGSTNAINASLYKNLPFDFLRDIAMVAGIMQGPLVLVSSPALPAKNVADVISYAKANPGTISMASAGNGTPVHLAGELFKMMAGVSMVHVPYRGGPAALSDLMAGRTQLMFAPIADATGLIRDGRLRALAVTSLNASPILPGIPPLAAVLPGYEVNLWIGLGAPKATPAGTIAVLNKAVNASLDDPAIVNRIREMGSEPMIMSPAELDAFVAADTARWAKAVKFSGAKVD
jgi:tripartite-type tricarboxylate transporter receptor subunit TctC/DNA-binding transcriptional LysR family regulator